MANTLIPRKSTIANKVPLPEQLAGGEVTVNWADQAWNGKHPGTGNVVPIGAPYLHSHDQLLSLDRSNELELNNAGELVLSVGAVSTTISRESGSANRVLTLPDKNGTIATTDDILSSVGAANAIVSQDATKKLTLTNTGALDYQVGSDTDTFSLPASGGTLALQGGDTYFGSNPPQSPYAGLRWIDTDLGRSFDWLVDSNNVGAWFETGVGSDGRQVNLRVGDGFIQWQYVGDSSWANLVAISSLKGNAGTNGSSVELRVTTTHIQWRLVGASTWNDLVDLEQITGPAGSNATVTTASINAALGYTPDNPESPRTPASHSHNDLYYTEAEIDTKLAAKQASGNYSVVGHTHDAGSITSGVLDPARIPAFSATNQVVSSGGLSALTEAQESEIITGTVVITSEGDRYIYKGSGQKTAEASYILLADITPSWSLISNKPDWLGTFNPATSVFSVSQVAGLATVATTGSYNNLIDKPEIPATQVNSDWNATVGISKILNKPEFASVAFSGDYGDLINKPEAIQKIRRSSWDAANLYFYSGTAALGTAENSASWSVTRIATTAGGSASSQTATGAWANRANLFP